MFSCWVGLWFLLDAGDLFIHHVSKSIKFHGAFSPFIRTPPWTSLGFNLSLNLRQTAWKSFGNGAKTSTIYFLGVAFRYRVNDTWEACRKRRSSGTSITAVIFAEGLLVEWRVSPRIGAFKTWDRWTRSWCFKPVCNVSFNNDTGAIAEVSIKLHDVKAKMPFWSILGLPSI